MTQLFKIFIAALFLIPALTSCSSSESPFVDGGGSSSTNIISSSNFGIGASALNPQVLEFAIGSIAPPSSTTANISDLVLITGSITSEITATAADNGGALVNSGTVFFATQYGTLSNPSCQITNGECSVTWTSILDTNKLTDFTPNGVIDIVNVVTAWTTGTEGFTDLDGNNVLSNNPPSAVAPNLYTENFIDTDSPYLDRNDNDTYDIAIDSTLAEINPYVPQNGLYEGACDNITRTDCSASISKIIYASVDLRLNYDSSSITAFNVVIDTPADNFTTTAGTNINFTATATDPEDGNITGTNSPVTGDDIVWASDIDGALTGNSNDINISTLTVATHIITVTATDSNGNTTQASITVTVDP